MGFSSQAEHRIELVEALDRIVAYQHYYHSVYGHYTKLLNRIGFSISRPLTDLYDIRVTEASKDHLSVTAFSEDGGKMLDQVSIDQDFQLHANFPIPTPRAEYLKSQAIKYLRLLKEAPNGQMIAEQGVFKGYFEYSTRTDSSGERSAVAKGILAPVVGFNLEMGQGGLRGTPDLESVKRSLTGQQGTRNTTSLEEEAYLAQKIFHGETGRYAESWSELEEIAHFRFEGKEQSAPILDRKVSSSSQEKALEIEPIGSNETE